MYGADPYALLVADAVETPIICLAECRRKFPTLQKERRIHPAPLWNKKIKKKQTPGLIRGGNSDDAAHGQIIGVSTAAHS